MRGRRTKRQRHTELRAIEGGEREGAKKEKTGQAKKIWALSRFAKGIGLSELTLTLV